MRGNEDDRDLARTDDVLLDEDARQPIPEARSASLTGTALEDEAASGYHGEPTIDTVYTSEATAAGGEGLTGEVQPDSPDAIRSDIDQTREEVAGTLDEIGARLDPGNLADQAKEKVREATIGRVEEAVGSAGETARGIGDMVMETIKRNPFPAALAGVGLALLWKNRADGQGQSRSGGTSYRYTDRYGYTGGYAGGEFRGSGDWQGSQGPGVTDRARQAAGGVADTASGAAQNVGRTAGQVAGTAQQAAGEAVQRGQQVAGEAVQRGQQAAEQVGTSFNELVRANPLGVAVAALGAGAAVGLLLPETEPEHRFLGEASDQVGRTIQQTASQAMDKVEEAADTAEQKVQEAQTA
ncbi:MAG TPA: DUF3618 domain-containing protein [Candidatus Limnocylindria bacterium]|nr:DUF3618 domain-containing protein [Candidatus Limnocylindria bacterium]